MDLSFSFKKIFNIHNLYFFFMIIASVLSMIDKVGVFILLLMIFIAPFLFDKKKNGQLLNKLLIFFMVYLPFYTLIRVSLVAQGLSTLSGFFNYLRDFLILVMLIITSIKSKMKDFRIKPVGLIITFNYFYGFLLSIINGYPSLGLTGLHLTLMPILIYFIVKSNFVTVKSETFYSLFLRIAFVIAVVGLFCYYARPDYYRSMFVINDESNNALSYVRFVSVFFTPNVCGCFFACSLCVALSLLIYKKNFAYLILILLFIFCLALTLSRGSWAFGLIAIVVTIFLLKPIVGLGLLPMFLFFFLIISINTELLVNADIFMLDVIIKRIESLFDFKNISAYERVNYWKTAMSILKDAPFGFGIGVSSVAQVSRGISTKLDVIDGFYIKTIVETGIFGIFFLISFVFWTLNKSIIAYKNKKNYVTMTGLLFVIGFLVQSFGSNTFDFVCAAPLVWISLGYAIKEQKKIVQTKIAFLKI